MLNNDPQNQSYLLNSLNILDGMNDNSSISKDKVNLLVSLTQTDSTTSIGTNTNDLLFSVTDKLISDSNNFINDVSAVNSVYSILDNLLPETTNKTESQQDVTQILKAENLIEKMNSNIYKNIQTGQNVKISTPKYSVQMGKMSKTDVNTFSVESDEEVPGRRRAVRVLVSSNDKSGCNPGSIMCLNDSTIKSMMNNTKDGILGINTKYNKMNILPIKQTNETKTFSTDSLNLTFLGGQGYRRLEEQQQNYYQVTLKIPSMKGGVNESLISSTACMQYRSFWVNSPPHWKCFGTLS